MTGRLVGPVIERVSPAVAVAALDDLAELYRAAFAGPPWNVSPDDARARRAIMRGQLLRAGGEAVHARSARHLAGAAWGWGGAGAVPPDDHLHAAVRSAVGPKLWRHCVEPPAVTVVEFMVAPSCQGKGLGRRLLDALVDGRPAWLLTHPGGAAPGFYAAAGWHEAGHVHTLSDIPLLVDDRPREWRHRRSTGAGPVSPLCSGYRQPIRQTRDVPAAVELPRLQRPPLVLRAFKDDDSPLVVEAASDPLIPLITTVPASPEPQSVQAFLDRQHDRARSGQGYSFAIADAASDRGMGQIGLWPLGGGRASVGYWIAPSARRRGLASLALTVLSEWALTLPGLARLELYVEPWNEGSWRAAERAGYQREGLLRGYQLVGDRRRDMYMYSLVSSPS